MFEFNDIGNTHIREYRLRRCVSIKKFLFGIRNSILIAYHDLERNQTFEDSILEYSSEKERNADYLRIISFLVDSDIDSDRVKLDKEK